MPKVIGWLSGLHSGPDSKYSPIILHDDNRIEMDGGTFHKHDAVEMLRTIGAQPVWSAWGNLEPEPDPEAYNHFYVMAMTHEGDQADLMNQWFKFLTGSDKEQAPKLPDVPEGPETDPFTGAPME